MFGKNKSAMNGLRPETRDVATIMINDGLGVAPELTTAPASNASPVVPD